MKKKIKVGVAGCGYWGPNLVRNMTGLSCEMRMVCDKQEARLKHLNGLHPKVEGTLDYGHMLNGVGLDAVMIITPVATHYPMAKAALKAGKHVFVEKPMCDSVAHCEELIEIAKDNGLVLMVGHTFLYSSAVRKIKEIVDSGEIGDIRYIAARRLNLGLFQKDINVAWDLAPHDLSIILSLLGETPETVNCHGGTHITPGIEDITTMCLSFSDQRSAIIHSSWLDPRKIREMTIIGSKKMVVYNDLESLEKIRVFDMRVEQPPHYDTFGEFQYSYHYGDMHAPYIRQEEPLKTECQHFLDCIENGKTPISDGQQGLEVVRILEAASESLRLNGGPVVLNDSPRHHNRMNGLVTVSR